jgi:hypothetical protein
MAKLFPEKIQLDGTSRLQKPRYNNQISKVSSSKNKNIGSSLVELLLATTLALVAVNASAQLISRHYISGVNSRAAANRAVEVAINNDLAWFRRYAVHWKCIIDPLNSLCSSPLSYQILPECPSTSTSSVIAMASAFRVDAANPATYPPLTVVPPSSDEPPNPVPNDARLTAISVPNANSVYNLERRIQPDPSVSGALTITYTLTVPGTSTPIFVRSSSLYLPAAGWCP